MIALLARSRLTLQPVFQAEAKHLQDQLVNLPPLCAVVALPELAAAAAVEAVGRHPA